MQSNKENTNPRTLRAVHNSNVNATSGTTYSCTPGAVGLWGWQPPQSHMFVSTPASATAYPAISYSSHSDAHSASDPARPKQPFSPIEARSQSRTGSPLKIRKTRENLRSSFTTDDTHASSALSPGKLWNHQLHKDVECSESIDANKLLVTVARLGQDSDNTADATAKKPSRRTSTESNDPVKQPTPLLSRKLSVRQRVVSRVKDGLLSRSRSSSKVASQSNAGVSLDEGTIKHQSLGETPVSKSLQDLKNDGRSLSGPSTFKCTQNVIPDSIVREKCTSPLSGLPSSKSDLQAFIERSDESFPSFSQPTRLSASLSPEKAPRPLPLSTTSPIVQSKTIWEQIGMLHVGLTVTPAWEALDVADEAIMWAMIKAEATVMLDLARVSQLERPNRANPSFHVSPSHPLDFIVIMDNDSFASPLALRSMCEIILSLCGLLHDCQDRIAVFCTCCPHRSENTDMSTGCQIHRLQSPNSRTLHAELANVEAGSMSSSPFAMSKHTILQEAVRSVLASKEKEFDGDTHVLVLSPLPRKCAAIFEELVSWPVHQVQVGYCYEAPSSHHQAGRGGWSLEWEGSPESALQRLVQSAREGSRIEELSHVKVSINSTHPCRVEKLLTPPRKSTLRPGQCTTLFAKVKIPSINSQRIREDPESLDDLYSELYRTLGCFNSELFRADVRYRHSHLPCDTELKTEQACELLRPNSSSQWSTALVQGENNGMKIELEKARFAARNYPSDVAIKILQRKFGDLWYGNNGTASLHRLREELEFQRKAVSEGSNEHAQNMTCQTLSPQASTGDRQLTLHIADTEAVQIPNTGPTTPPLAQESNNLGYTDGIKSQDSPVEQDEARRIWRHMRRNSRTTPGQSSTPEAIDCVGLGSQQQQYQRGSQESVMDRMAAADTRLREIRLQAIQNKRSVGAETLRDFGLMQHSEDERDEAQYEACVQWV